MSAKKSDRARGCMMGQLAGDSLGSLVEFLGPEEIWRHYPDGVRDLSDGGTWGTIAGQPTDDSEMALLLARKLIEIGRYDSESARQAYIYWLETEPFDCGMTIYSALKGSPNPSSQANGALMRASPIAIFGARHELGEVATWARQDAALTHPNLICQQANALYVMLLAVAIKEGLPPKILYQELLVWARSMQVEPSLQRAIDAASSSPPEDFTTHQGWVLIAFQNALWQLLHSSDLEDGVVDTVMRGGDTDTNAAICGALLGAVHGLAFIPSQWTETVLKCRPLAGSLGVKRPRPEVLWPCDAIELADKLLESGPAQT